jgi:hypothetical protein
LSRSSSFIVLPPPSARTAHTGRAPRPLVILRSLASVVNAENELPQAVSA